MSPRNQDLVDDHGFTAKYASVRRFVGKLRGTAPIDARVVITTAPGEEGQVDYGGDGPMVRDPSTHKYKRARLFVLTLGYSRKCVRLLTWRSSARIWAELHERAFRRHTMPAARNSGRGLLDACRRSDGIRPVEIVSQITDGFAGDIFCSDTANRSVMISRHSRNCIRTLRSSRARSRINWSASAP